MGAFSGPETADSGIVLALDAANTRSYVGSGTTWIDLIGSNNGTLTNGPVFTQEPKLEPFGGAGAVSFDGSGDYLELADSADFDFGSGEFTVEAFIQGANGGSRTASVVLNQSIGNASSDSAFYFGAGNTGTSLYLSTSGTAWTNYIECAGLVHNSGWHHIAWQRRGDVMEIYVDGIKQTVDSGNAAITGSVYNSSRSIDVGRQSTSGSNFLGHISNLRVIKGTALYTSNFTPKRQPLIPESAPNTVLLTCQKGTIRDRSPSAHAITINGDAKSISGASYFEFDGTDDYVTIPSSTLELDTDTNFTLEYWVYTSTSGLAPSVNVNAGTSKIIAFFIRNASSSTFYAILSESNYPSSGNSIALQATTDISTNTWTHISIVRLSGTITIYMNGVASGSVSNSYSSRPLNLIGAIAQGGAPNFYFMNGYISNIRIYKGKGLTASEVKQNYRNTKSRYGL